MTITKTDVTDWAPELLTGSRPTNNAWTDILAYVNEFDLTLTGESAQTDRVAKLNLAAHIATVDRRASSETAGPVTSVSAGNVRRSYGLIASATSSASLSSTRYGQAWLEILGASLCAGPVLI